MAHQWNGKDVFVFGSNTQGLHGAGAALFAANHAGAAKYKGEGHYGKSYALPTCGPYSKKYRRFPGLPFNQVIEGVNRFLEYAKAHPGLTFFVTRVGCGLAGFKDAQIGPLFATAPSNCRLPPEWAQYIRKEKQFMHVNKIYTGIGSRETPEDILKLMIKIGYALGQAGWTLRSGHAEGADQAFELGAIRADSEMEIYLPWKGFNGAPTSPIHQYIPIRDYHPEAVRVAEMFHPAWDKCSNGARKLHQRNVYQVAGIELDTATAMVICWTKDGKRQGGTGQALRMAEHLKIPIFDLAVCKQEDILDFVNHGVVPFTSPQ